jgi:hypothetical protein
MGWREELREREIRQRQRLNELEGKYNRPTNYDGIMSDVEALKKDPNALNRDKQLELLAYMKSAGMDKEFDELVNTLRPPRKARFKAGAQGLLDNWLAFGLVDDKTYATNPHTEKDKAIGQLLGSIALFGVGHPLAWLTGRAGIGMKLGKATKVAKVATSPATASSIAKAAATIGRATNVASGVSSVGKSIKPVVGLASGKYDDPWNEIKLRDKMSEITDPFVYSDQFINK